MPEVREYFPEIDAMDVVALHARRQALLDPVKGNYKDLADDVLAEVFAVTRALRKKAAAPGTGGGRKKASGPKQKPTLESLA